MEEGGRPQQEGEEGPKDHGNGKDCLSSRLSPRGIGQQSGWYLPTPTLVDNLPTYLPRRDKFIQRSSRATLVQQ